MSVTIINRAVVVICLYRFPTAWTILSSQWWTAREAYSSGFQ